MANRRVLKDAQFRVIGFLDTAGDGSQTLQDAHHRLIGYYKRRSDVTTDPHHRIVGRGNILLSLLPER